MFLIDTNILILALNNKQPEATILANIAGKGTLYLSVISLAEFLSQASVSEKKGFQKMSVILNLINVDEDVARQAAKYRSDFLKSSRTKLLDYLIAAQAKLNKLRLVTNNKSDFPMMDIKVISPDKL